jgi:hypothetical protein
MTVNANRHVATPYIGLVVVASALLAMPAHCDAASSKTSCKHQKYDCHDYKEDVDVCRDGHVVLRGTNILFRCNSGD